VNGSDPSGDCVKVGWWCIGGGAETSSISFGFNPGAGANAIVNIGRGASFGLSNTIANWISPGASCTVADNSFDELLGSAGATLAGGEVLSGWVAPETAGGGGPDFVAGPIGSEPPVPISQSRMAAGFDEAGFPSTPTASPGTEYTLPDGTKVRLMEPSGQAPMRASFTNANDGPINPFTGKPVQPPPPAGWTMRAWVRALTHVEQTP